MIQRNTVPAVMDGDGSIMLRGCFAAIETNVLHNVDHIMKNLRIGQHNVCDWIPFIFVSVKYSVQYATVLFVGTFLHL